MLAVKVVGIGIVVCFQRVWPASELTDSFFFESVTLIRLSVLGTRCL
jgi:hypothetical protein